MRLPWESSKTKTLMLVALSAFFVVNGFVTGESVNLVFMILGLSGAHKAYVEGTKSRLPNALYCARGIRDASRHCSDVRKVVAGTVSYPVTFVAS